MNFPEPVQEVDGTVGLPIPGLPKVPRPLDTITEGEMPAVINSSSVPHANHSVCLPQYVTEDLGQLIVTESSGGNFTWNKTIGALSHNSRAKQVRWLDSDELDDLVYDSATVSLVPKTCPPRIDPTETEHVHQLALQQLQRLGQELRPAVPQPNAGDNSNY